MNFISNHYLGCCSSILLKRGYGTVVNINCIREKENNNETVRRRSFQNAFSTAMDDEKIWSGIHSNAVNLVWKHMTKLCNLATTIMKSNGVPAAACTSFTKNFKIWFKSYYDA